MSTLVQDLIKKLKSGDISTKSKFNLRSEKAQTKIQLKGIPKLKREVKKRSKILIPLEIAVPFNPFTGEEDDEFNATTKYRPLLSATSSALVLKGIANENEKVKEEFISRAGMEEWDTSDIETLTEEDKKIFRSYRVPKVFTIPVASIHDQRITGFDFNIDYSISVDRDPITGQVRGDWPLVLQANKLYRDMVFEEINNIDKCVEAAKKGEPYELLTDVKELRNMPPDQLADIVDKDLKEYKKKVYQKIKFGEDRPSNYIVAYELPLKNDLSLNNEEDYQSLTREELDKFMVYTRETKEIREQVIESFRNGTYSRQDVHYDFWEIDMICPTNVDDPDNAMEVGKETRYSAAQIKLVEYDFSNRITDNVRESLDDSENLEDRFLFSARIKKLDSSIEDKIADVIEEDNLLEHPFMTRRVLQQNADFISKVYGEDGDLAVTSATVGIDDRKDGELDDVASAKLGKEINIEKMLDDDSVEAEDEEENNPSEENKKETETVKAEVIELD